VQQHKDISGSFDMLPTVKVFEASLIFCYNELGFELSAEFFTTVSNLPQFC